MLADAASTLQRDILNARERLIDVTTRDDLRAELLRMTQAMGFSLIGASVILDSVAGESCFITIDNAPPLYRESLDDPRMGKRDPVMQHCKRSHLPIAWDQSTYVEANEGEKWENQAAYGYRTGVCWAMHLPQRRHFLVGMDGDEPLPNSASQRAHLLAALMLFGVHVQEVAERVLLPRSSPNSHSCTKRELECLKWTLAGKTAWELAQILCISEHTAARHLCNAAAKLGCAGKHQAAMRALHLRLID